MSYKTNFSMLFYCRLLNLLEFHNIIYMLLAEHGFASDAKKMTPTRTDHQVFLLPEIRVQIIKILHATRSDSPFKTERVGVVKFCVQRETIERE